MIEVGPFTVEFLIAAFAGGILGATLGGLASFSIAGFVIIVGETASALGRSVAAQAGDVDPSLVILADDLTTTIGLGPLLGPHVAFAGGVAAAAFAADRGYIPEADAGTYHPAKAVDIALGSRPDVLLVGGLFGAFGYVVAVISGSVLQFPLDPVALGIVVSGFVHRAVFGYDLVGTPAQGWLDMAPYHRGETRPDSDRPLVEPWLPHQMPWANNLVLGLGVGLASAYIAYVTASPFLAFGIGIFLFIFVIIDAGKPPIVLHMALPASIAALALMPSEYGLSQFTPELVAAEVPLLLALALGALFGAIAGLLGEFFQRTLYAHADTHLDPPACAIVVTTLLIGILVLVGILPNAVVLPTP